MARSSSRLGRLKTGAAALAIGAAASALFVSAPTGPVEATAAATPEPQATPAAVATVERRPVTRWSEFSGRLEAVDRVDIRSRVAGAVQAVHFREGALVEKGARLFTIDQSPFRAEVDRMKAQLAGAEARVALARSDLERGRKMTALETISQRDLDQRVNGLRESEAARDGAAAALRTAQLELDYTEVRAPVSGRVGRIEITEGNLIAAGPGAPALTNLVSVSPVYASFDADEATVLRALDTLPEGGDRREKISDIPVEMTLSSGGAATVRGKLQFVAPSVDARSGSVRVRASFDNADGRLMPGQFARLKLGEAKPAAEVLVSERAVGTDQDKRFVLVVGADDKALWREVALGAPADGLRIVTRGLEPGERVVVEGLALLKPGALVAPRPVAMDGSPKPERQASAALK